MEAIFLEMSCETQSFKLPKILRLGGYGCAVLEMKASIEPHLNLADLFLCSNFTKELILGDVCVPVLRQIPLSPDISLNRAICNEKFKKMVWIPVTRDNVDEVQLYICNRQGVVPSFQSLHLSCTLLFIPHIELL